MTASSPVSARALLLLGGAGLVCGLLAGWSWLADRVAALDGRLTVRGAAGSGTSVRAEIPLRE